MGCDIHIIVQHRMHLPYWYTVFPLPEERCPTCVEWYLERPREPLRVLSSVTTWAGSRERNYALFAVLADVRNHWDLKPIAKPRGFPRDFHVEEETENWAGGPGDHSESWLTLDELQCYDWSQRIKFSDTGTKTLREAVADFYSVFMPNIAKLGGPDDVRIVFSFDS